MIVEAMNKVVQEFVFGYGSLICPVSRAITAPSLAQKTVTPVVVNNVERTWAKRIPGLMTAMGVRFKDDAQCVGVLLPVNKQELKQFDLREYGYDRVPLYLGDVEKVPFLHDEHYQEEEHEVFLKAKEREHAIRVWMYMQQETTPPSDDAPIVQSYVDTILRGCLTISEGFADEFITKTKGWTPNELVEEEDVEIEDASMESRSVSSIEVTKDDVHWVNDRQDPIYRRGDQNYMLRHGHKLDAMLRKHRDEIKYRFYHTMIF